MSGYREGKGYLHETKGSSYKGNTFCMLVKALSGEILSMGRGNRFWKAVNFSASLKGELVTEAEIRV